MNYCGDCRLKKKVKKEHHSKDVKKEHHGKDKHGKKRKAEEMDTKADVKVRDNFNFCQKHITA